MTRQKAEEYTDIRHDRELTKAMEAAFEQDSPDAALYADRLASELLELETEELSVLQAEKTILDPLDLVRTPERLSKKVRPRFRRSDANDLRTLRNIRVFENAAGHLYPRIVSCVRPPAPSHQTDDPSIVSSESSTSQPPIIPVWALTSDRVKITFMGRVFLNGGYAFSLNIDQGQIDRAKADTHGFTGYFKRQIDKWLKAVFGGRAPLTDDATELVSGRPIFNILNNVELPLVKSLGSSRVGAISFTSYFGPNVTEGLASIEKAESALNNIACLGYEDGERVLWGGTQRRGKIWQQKAGTVSEWIAWTKSTWAKVITDTGTSRNITEDFLRPEKIDKPYSSHPIAVQWGEQAQMRYNDRQFILFGAIEVALFAIDLEIGEVNADGHIDINIISDQATSVYRLLIDGSFPGGYRHDHIHGPILQFRKNKEQPVSIEEYLQKDPFIIRYVDGTYSYNCYHIPTALKVGLYDIGKLEAWDWGSIPLNKESMHKSADQDTIQYRAFEQLEAEYDLIFNDDGCGEAGDLVCLKDVDDSTILLCLVHCKGAYQGRVSRDIRNFYTVCGQAQKSITAKHGGLPTLYYDLKRRQETWAREGKTRFLKGDMKKLSYFKEKARRSKLEFEVVLVQPGASIATVTEDSLRLLATTELYLLKTTQARMRVIVSP